MKSQVDLFLIQTFGRYTVGKPNNPKIFGHHEAKSQGVKYIRLTTSACDM